MRMITFYLTDEQLLVLAKIALAPGGVVGDWGNALQEVGLDAHTAAYLVHEGYLKPVMRHAAGGSMPHYETTAKGRRELMIRFVD